ncbi:MAG: hypothetical protein JJP05_00880 [cyanobacterium endosymbiont of Rhopalodia gibba]
MSFVPCPWLLVTEMWSKSYSLIIPDNYFDIFYFDSDHPVMFDTTPSS